jgi:hypothetical protein
VALVRTAVGRDPGRIEARRGRSVDGGERERPGGWVAVDHDHVPEVREAPARLEHRRQVRLLDDRDLRLGVADQVRDLVRG